MGVAQMVPSLRLRDGTEIPQLGFDLYPVPAEATQRAVESALEVGYRHLDTAAAYSNESEVGAALAASGLSRQDYFVTTKLWCSRQDQDATLKTFEESLARLGLDQVDLCLIFWPLPTGGRFGDNWRALERLHREGAARSIGVANFGIGDLELLEQRAEVLPTVNQIEFHPFCQEANLLAWHAEHGIVTAAWSPLAQGDLLDDEPAIARLAGRNGKTLTQLILRWHLQLGNVVVAGSVTPEGIRENIDLFDFELTDEELAAIARLDSNFTLLR
jgi:diketogulonate reductase-like aldo/keto reductase